MKRAIFRHCNNMLSGISYWLLDVPANEIGISMIFCSIECAEGKTSSENTQVINTKATGRAASVFNWHQNKQLSFLKPDSCIYLVISKSYIQGFLDE